MQPRVYIVMLSVLVVGCLLLAAARPDEPLHLRVAERHSDTLTFHEPDTLDTRQEYYLELNDTLDRLDAERWFWRVEHADSLYKNFFELPNPPFTASQPGSYVVKAYHAMREVACDTLFFKDGERVSVNWPRGTTSVNTPLHFEDGSTQVRDRLWLVLEGGDTLAREHEERLEWTPRAPGDYTVRLVLRMNSGADEVREHHLHASQPVAEKRWERPPASDRREVVRKEPPVAPSPQVQVKEEEPVVLKNGDCFFEAGGALGRAGIVRVSTAAPTASQVSWKGSGTVFEIVPTRDCQLASFAFWGKNADRAGDATVTIKCLEDLCKGKDERKGAFQISFDLDSPQEATFSKLPVMRAGYRYRVQVKPDEGAPMGHFLLDKTTYVQDGFTLSFQQQESSLFNITFRVK